MRSPAPSPDTGARVAIAGRTQETLARAAAAIEEECGRAGLDRSPADVAEAADCERMIATAVDRFGAVDILVNNAALFAVLPLIDADAAEAARFFAVNAIGPLNAARGLRALGDRSQARRRDRQRQQHRRRTACAGPWPLFGVEGGARQLDPIDGGRMGGEGAARQRGRAWPCRDGGGAGGLTDRPARREGRACAQSRPAASPTATTSPTPSCFYAATARATSSARC